MAKKNRVKLRHPVTGEAIFCTEERAEEIRTDIEAADDGPKALADMTKAELVEYAAANDIEIDEKANKADLLADIEATQE